MTPNQKYAGFWIRFLAEYLEVLFSFLIFSYVIFSISQSSTLTQVWQYLIKYFVFIALPWAFLSIFVRSILTTKFGGGIGKLLTGLKVENSNHQYLTFKRSLFRYTIGYTFSSVLLFLGFFSIIKDPEKQAFHDKIVGSHVVTRQTLWPLALILLVITLFGNYYFLTQAYSKAITGPLKFEVLQLVNDYQQQKKNTTEATMSATLQPKSNTSTNEASSSAIGANPASSSINGNIIFVSLKDSVTASQAQPLVQKLQTNPSVLRVQFLTKAQATQAYQSVSPNKSLPVVNLSPTIIVFLKDLKNNPEILNEAKSDSLVQAAYPYSF